MNARARPCRKTVVRLAAVAPQPETTRFGNVRQAWRSSLQRANDGDEGLVSGLEPVPEGSPAFVLVSLHQLPAFDASKTIKTILLTPDLIRRLNEFRIRWKHVIAMMLQLGNLLMLLTTVAPRRLGSMTAVLASILQFPGIAFVMGSVRIEMVYLLFGTYDFWYFTVNNIIFGVCFIAMLQDVRIIVVLVGCLIVQLSIGSDALVGDRRQLFMSSVINCGTHCALLTAVSLKLVDDSDRGDAFVLSYSSSGYGFSIRDTLMNSQANMVLLFGRLVYRNWIAVREQDYARARRINSQTSYIPGRRQCVSYYCTVGLRLKNGNARHTILCPRNTSSITRFSTNGSQSTRSRAGSVLSMQTLENYHTLVASRARLSSVGAQEEAVKGRIEFQNARFDPHQRRRTGIQTSTKIQLQFVSIGKDFNAYTTLVPGFGHLLDRILGSNARNEGRRVLLDMLLFIFHAVGYLGIGGLVLGALVAWISKDQNLDNIRPGLARSSKAAFFASLVFCGVFFASYQRQLLMRLYSSFNFLFLSTKLTVASLALSQFFVWDHRVVWVWGAWIWMQWAITLDALPPSTTHLLAFRRSTLMLSVLVFELIGLVLLSLELFAFDRWIIPDRAVVDRVILGRHVRVSTLSALASRLLTIFLWDCKLIWFLTASLRRQRRRLNAIDTDESNEDDEEQRLLLTGRVEYFYELASHNRPRDAKSRWSKGLQILRFIRRRTRAKLHNETQ